MDCVLSQHFLLIVLLRLFWQVPGSVSASIEDYFELNAFPDPNENDVMMERSPLDTFQRIVNSGTSRNMGELPEYEVSHWTEPPDDLALSLHSSAYIEWCEEGRRKRVSSSQCPEITFVPPFPTCYCIEGVVSVHLDETRNCQSGIHYAKGECFKFSAFGHGVRSLRFVRKQSFHPTDFIVADEQSDVNRTWRLSCPNDDHPGVSLRGKVGILNGQLFQDGEGKNCIQKLGSSGGMVYMYKNIFGQYNASWDECPGSAITDSRCVQQIPIHSPDSQLCSISCPPYYGPEVESEGDDEQKETGSTTPSPNSATVDVCRPIPPELKSLHDDLNARILRRSIETAFKNPRSDTFGFNPIRSFRLLSQMAEIAAKVCENAGIGAMLLSNAVDLLQVAHEGRGYYFHEDFSDSDFQHISSVLSDCLQNNSPILFRRDGCNGDVTEVFNKTAYEPVTLPEEHEYFTHHIALDIPWAVVDLVNVICVDHFHQSYRMYHLLEQGMEKLYTKELRAFWLYPDAPRNLNERLFGPNWPLQLKNLQLCVKGAYMTAGKVMYPLNRPTWLPGSETRTRAQKVCRRRRTNEKSKILSTIYEIYCDPLDCT